MDGGLGSTSEDHGRALARRCSFPRVPTATLLDPALPREEQNEGVGLPGPVSIRDVAARAGVSVGTVSNVLNHADLVAPDTRARVLDAINSLGFVRNESARQLRAGRSRTIGLVVLDVANPFFTDVARGVEDVASQASLSVILCNTDGKIDKQERYLAVLAEQRVQGILLSPASAVPPTLDAIRQHGIPVVLLDQKAQGSTQCSVSVDDVTGGALAMNHLLEQGHERLAFVGGKGPERQLADRFRGANRALGKDQQRTLRLIDVPGLNVAGGRHAGAEIVRLPASQRPTGVFCANDLLALGVLQALTEARLRVPQQVALVGYDDIEFASAAAIPLSSVRQPRYEIGQRAAELILEEASGEPHKHQQVVLRAELVTRESSRHRRRRSTRSARSAAAEANLGPD